MAVLLSREKELARIDLLIARARSGSGAVALVEGPAGMGKTALLAVAARRAAGAGLTVLRGGGALLEREHAYGVARQLFVPALAAEADGHELLTGAARLAGVPLGLDSSEREPEREPEREWGDPAAAAMHGLYWLTARLAERGPLLLELDDAHWADEMSLRFVLYLARRLDDMPVLALLAARPDEDGPLTRQLLTQLRDQPGLEILPLGPLSAQAVVHVAREVGLPRAEPGFVAACVEATRGNPFLLRALLDGLLAAGATGSDADVERMAGIAPERVGRWVSARLSALGTDAERLAAALAVLGAGAPLGDAALLAELDRARAAAAADALVSAGIVNFDHGYAFVHPLVQAAVLDQLPPALRSEAHARAARLSGGRGEPLPHVAAHLLAAGPRGDPWALETLRAAARDARDRGAPASAARYLTEALREPVIARVRAELLVELGEAELQAGMSGATGHVEDALALLDDPPMRAQIFLALGRAQFARGDHDVARGSFRRGLAEIPGGDSDLYLELSTWSMIDAAERPELAPAAAARLQALLDGREPGASRIERRLLAGLAYLAARTGNRQAREVAVLAGRALADGELLRESGAEMGPYAAACYALIAAGNPGEAAAELTRAIGLSQRRGSWLAFGWFSYLRGVALYSQGALPAAEADLESAAEAFTHGGAEPMLETRATLALCRIERDDLAGAAGACAEAELRPGESIELPSYLYALARLRVSDGQLQDALDLLVTCGRVVRAMNAPNPAANFPWRADAALLAAGLGEPGRARELIEENLRLARAFGAPLAIAIAVRSAGLLAGEGDGIDQLTDAVALLEAGEHELQLARTLVELGAALRRAGRRRAALDPLRRGMDLASRCGSRALWRRARDELITAGARPRRERTSGTDALTASELRVARMAASGMSNPEIAQILFITRKTVAGHLTHVYQKLDIQSRGQLADALDGEPAAGAGATASS